MIQPGTLDLVAQRYAPFSIEIEVRGLNLTGATLLAQIRLRPNTPDPVLVNLAQVSSASAEGVRFISATTVNSLPVSVIGIRVNETTVEGLPFASVRSDPMKLAWDLHVTPTGKLKSVLLRGAFTVEAGVTQ